MKRVWSFLIEKKYLVFGVVCVIFLALTMKTQVVILKYGDKYAMRMEYSIFGSCVRASAALKATEPAVYNAVYFWGSIDGTVSEAVDQMSKLNDNPETVGIMVTGYPRNSEKLENHLKKLLENEGYKVEILNVSLKDVFK